MAKHYVELPQKRIARTSVKEGLAETIEETPQRIVPAVPSSSAEVDIVYSLDRIALELAEAIHRAAEAQGIVPDEGADSLESPFLPRALVLTQGKAAKGTFLALAEAGLGTVAPLTGDWRLDVNPKMALTSVPLGTKPARALFTNAYALLEAAEAAGVHSIFLGGASLPLGRDNRFLHRAAAQGIRVFMPLELDPTHDQWIECSPSTDDDAPMPTSWRTCHSCKLTFDNGDFVENGYACPHCNTLARLSSDERIALVLDEGSFVEWDTDLPDADPLEFPGYGEKIASHRERSGLDEAVRTGIGTICGMTVAVGFMDSSFFMGSMGTVVGEKVSRLFDRATAQELPVVLFCASGGARMQEGLASLMQMAKTACAVERHDRAGLLYISVLTDPTTGGVTASFATLGDIILAEPGTLIGFAGQRVIRDTIKQELPEGFQTAEFALEHGLIDAIVRRHKMRKMLATILALHESTTVDLSRIPGYEMPTGSETDEEEDVPVSNQDKRKLERHAKRAMKRSGLSGQADPGSAWESVQLARNVHRPTARTYIRAITDVFFELHGDRAFADDAAIIAGLGSINGTAVTLIAQEKGSNLKDRIRRNFGCPQPEGYRKSARLMRQAQKFGRPIVCLVDTQGAFCGTEAEERGQGNAIAENLELMAGLTVPVISVLLGEGGSGGALALAVSNRVAMQEHAVYSVLSPEGFASILWKDGKRAPEAAEIMGMNAAQVYKLGVVDAVIPEGEGGAHADPDRAIENVRAYIVDSLEELSALSPDELLTQRQERFGRF